MSLKTILRIAAVVESATGLALILAPAVVVALLIGLSLPSVGVAVARVAGLGLLGLALASWPSHPTDTGPAFRGMLVYNALVALYFLHLGLFRHVAGPLLWPAVVFHAVLALLLLWTSRTQRVKRPDTA